MVQSVRISVVFVLAAILIAVALGQLDHFLPPPPARYSENLRGFPPRSRNPSNDFLLKNPYLSRAYGGTWFRSNFQDLFSYRGAQKLEWFEVLEGNDCSPVPATVNAGRPPRDICNEAKIEERRCICINTGRGKSTTGYEPICGNCRDPCQLKFTPDRVPKYLQRLAAQDPNEEKEKEYEYDDYEEDN